MHPFSLTHGVVRSLHICSLALCVNCMLGRPKVNWAHGEARHAAREVLPQCEAVQPPGALQRRINYHKCSQGLVRQVARLHSSLSGRSR